MSHGGMKTLKVTLVAALTACASSVAAQSEDWRHLWSGDALEAAADMGSFSGPATARAARITFVSMRPDDDGGYVVADLRIDCVAHTVSTVGASFFSAEGSLLERREVPASETTKPLRETDGTAPLARAACDGADIAGAGFATAGAFVAWAKTSTGD